MSSWDFLSNRQHEAMERLARELQDRLTYEPNMFKALTREPERRQPVQELDGDRVVCECGITYGIGDSPWCKDKHAPVQPRGGFEPRFDIALGEYVTGWGDVKQHMRRKHLDYREHPSAGDLSARRDRIEEGKRQQR